MMKIRSGIKLKVCIFSILAFVFSSLFFQHAQAISEDVDASIVVHRDSMLSITLGGDIENGAASINITPYDSNGVFNETGDVTATVVSTNRNGYTLGMDSSTSALINTTNSSATVDELAADDSGYPKADIPVNKWGYSLKTDEAYGNYFGLGDGVELQNVSGPTDGTISTLRFGAKVDASIPAGAYETTIVFTLTTKM